MIRIVGIIIAAASLVACVTNGTYQKEVDRANNATALALSTQGKLDEANKTIGQIQDDLRKATEAAKAMETDLRAKLKVDDDQITSLQKSNKDLTTSLDANRSSLGKKVGQLIADRDALAQKLADTSRAKDEQIAALTKQMSDLQAEKDALQKEKEAELERVKKSYEDVAAGLKSEIASGQIQISQLKGRLTLKMVDKILFDSGRADVKDEGRSVLDRIAEALKSVPDKDIRIEGHTDNVPIRGELAKRFPTNWELSTARATAVARYLQDKDDVDPRRLSVAGYADTRPVAPNDTEESRALNRRIEIVLVPHE